MFVRDDVSEAVRSKQKGLLPLRNSPRDVHNRTVIRYDKLRTDVVTFTFDLKKQEIVRLDSTPVSIGTFTFDLKKQEIVRLDSTPVSIGTFT